MVRSSAAQPERRGRQVDENKHRKYERLAPRPDFETGVELATAYVSAAIDAPRRTEGEFWALSCLPGTTPRRLSALTMRITDILVIYRAEPVQAGRAEALVIVERSTLETGFGTRGRAHR